jgi:recombination protein RecR
MSLQDSIDRLAASLSKLPGVGKRSAERMAYKLAREPESLIPSLASALNEVRERVRVCAMCGSLTAVGHEPCNLCSNPARDSHLLCVVEDPADIVAIEKSGGFRGRYHALMGRLSPMKREGPEDMRLKALIERVKSESVEEIVLALNTDVESDATAAYIAEILSEYRVNISRLAFGLPAGSGISYSDSVTLARAFEGRQPV